MDPFFFKVEGFKDVDESLRYLYTLPRLDMYTSLLPDLQGYNRKHRKQDADYPEPDDDLHFRHAFFLIVVMEGRHQKYAAAFAIFSFGVLKVCNLNNHREIFDQKDTTEDGDQQLFAEQDAHRSDNPSYGQASSISHKNLSGVGIVP